jgi:hypothetical protein
LITAPTPVTTAAAEQRGEIERQALVDHHDRAASTTAYLGVARHAD